MATIPSSKDGRPNRRWTSSRLSEGQFSFLLTIPLIVVLLAVVAYPIGYSIWLSVHRIDVIFKRTEYVGIDNFRKAFTDPRFSPEIFNALQVTLYYTIVTAVIALVIAVGGALLLNEKFRGRPVLMTVVILPWAVSLYATAIVWKYLFSPEWGLFNAVLTRLNIIDKPMDFLSEDRAVVSVAFAHAWQVAPLGIYFILATLQLIPEDLFKMAKVDRLGTFGRFRNVIFPYIKAPLLIVMVLITVEAARVFDTIFFMTNGGPGDVTTTLTWLAYRETFQKRDYGLGSATGWILVAITTVITTAYFLLLFYRRKTRIDADGRAVIKDAVRVGRFTLSQVVWTVTAVLVVVLGFLWYPEMMRSVLTLLAVLGVVGGAIVAILNANWRARRVVTYVLAAILLVWTLIPIYWLLNMSFMYHRELLSVPTHLFPHDFNRSNYIRVRGGSATGPGGEELLPMGQAPAIKRGLINSTQIALMVTFVTMLVALPVSYALGRLNFRGKNIILFTIISTRSYPPISIVIPFFYLYAQWNLIGTKHGLALIYFTLTVPMIVWVLTGFFAQLPRTVEAAARVDGNTRFQAFYRVILPMSWPGIAVASAISFMVCWNEFAFASFLTNGSPAMTFPPVLPAMFFQISAPTEMAAASIIGIIPPAILAYLFQSRIRSLNLVDPL